jgi:8-oxo-dGTP diphosphatase
MGMAMSGTGLKQAVVMVVLRSDDALLLLHRTKEPNLSKYVPVGGHIEPFEAPRAAAIREVREETGKQLDDIQFHGVLVETSPTNYNWVVFVYSAEVEHFDPPDCAEGVLEWVPSHRVPDLPTPATDNYIYPLIVAGQHFVLNAEFDQDLHLEHLEEELSGQVLCRPGCDPAKNTQPKKPPSGGQRADE